MSRNQLQHTNDLFVGARLGAARERAGIPLEQAARDTRIRVQRLREIETDDFSGFAHPTYARLFLLDYAAYLGVPQDEIRPLLPDQAIPAASGFQYLEALGDGSSLPTASGGRRKRSRFHPLVFVGAIGIVLLLIFAGFSIWLTVRKIERISRPAAAMTGVDQDAVQPTPEPTPELSPSPTPEPTPEPLPPEEAADLTAPPAPADPSTLWEMAPPGEATPLPSPTLP